MWNADAFYSARMVKPKLGAREIKTASVCGNFLVGFWSDN
jgi:hypothetical protein